MEKVELRRSVIHKAYADRIIKGVAEWNDYILSIMRDKTLKHHERNKIKNHKKCHCELPKGAWQSQKKK